MCVLGANQLNKNSLDSRVTRVTRVLEGILALRLRLTSLKISLVIVSIVGASKCLFPVQAAILQARDDWRANRAQAPVKRLLGESWAGLHIMQHAAEADDMKIPAAKASKCLKYGTCCCQGHGFSARMFHENLAQFLRPNVISRTTKAQREEAKRTGVKIKKKPFRVLLETSMICLCLTAEPVYTVRLDKQGWPVLDDDSDSDGTLVANAPSQMWLRVNYINFKDMECTFLKLQPVPGNPIQPGRVVLTVPQTSEPEVQRSCVLFARVDLERSWKASWHRIISDKEILSEAEFVPDVVEVVELDAAILPSPNPDIWKGLRAEITRRKQTLRSRGAQKGSQNQKRQKPGQASAGKRLPRKLETRASPSVPATEAEEDVEADEAADAVDDGGGYTSQSGSDSEREDRELSDWEKLAEVGAWIEGHGDDAAAGPASSASVEAVPAVPEATSVGATAAHAATTATDLPDAAAAPRQPSTRKKTVVEEVLEFKADGQLVGTLHFNSRTRIMTAHCNFDGHGLCRKQRVCTAGPKPGQGRPIGFLCAWLRDGCNWSSGHEHVHLSTKGLKHERRNA